MNIKSTGNGRYELEATRSELELLNNALNEVCNGVAIEDAEFATRLGASRREARRLLDELSTVL
jgi:hypothetical protein